MSDVAARYPLCSSVLAQLLRERDGSAAAPTTTTAFRIGPGVLRAPPKSVRPPTPPTTTTNAAGDDDGRDVDDMLGELTDMLLVGADEGKSGHPEVHLQFKSDVLGGLHLRLVKKPEGFSAVFVVDDAATRRAVSSHVDALVDRLRARGFTVIEARLEVGGG